MFLHGKIKSVFTDLYHTVVVKATFMTAYSGEELDFRPQLQIFYKVIRDDVKQ